VQQSPEEIKGMVVKMAGEGMTMAKLGLVLRDQYGVPNVKLATGLSVKEILDEAGVKSDLPEDLANLMRRAVELSRHVALNPKDHHNKRGMQLVESKIRRLTKYYKREGVIPETWSYSLSTAALQVE
jgi:small subunit ribosomal protein S15